MNMNPKYALLSAVLLIAVIFIVGCHNTTTDPAAKYFTNQSCENISNQSEQNSCYEELALSRQKVEICEKIITPDPFNSGKMTCYIKIAEKTGNTSLCLHMQDMTVRQYAFGILQFQETTAVYANLILWNRIRAIWLLL